MDNDLHPTPLDQWRFANEVVAPYIGLTEATQWNS